METKHIALISFVLLAIGASFFYPIQTSVSDQAIYKQWKDDYGMKFTLEEDSYRIKIFLNNLKVIKQHNSNPSKTYNKAVNKFTGLTKEQFQNTYLMQDIPVTESSFIQQKEKIKIDVNSGQIDWTTRGAVTRVKDQLSCSASYAFAAVGAMEGMEYIFRQRIFEFSNQQIVDCSRNYGNNGCSSGSAVSSYAWTRDRGIQADNYYPYTGYYQNCRNSGGPRLINSYRTLSGCQDLQSTIFSQPISVVINASNMKDYGSGLFSDCPTDSRTRPNYAALLVGMKDSEYKLKFSLGYSFGENGFVRISRNPYSPQPGKLRDDDNVCGICNQASIPQP